MRVAEFGADQAPPEQATFGFYGHEIRVAEEASELEFIDFMEAYGDMDEDDPRGFKATKDLLRSFIHGDDFDTFWAAAKVNRLSLEQLLAVVRSVVEALSGRPTSQPSGSAGGLGSTAPKSGAGSSWQDIAQRQIDGGRTDLANVVYMAQEAISAS